MEISSGRLSEGKKLRGVWKRPAETSAGLFWGIVLPECSYNGGRRTNCPLQDILAIEEPIKRKESRPIHPPGQRQRKQKYAKSTSTSPRCTTPRGSHSCLPPVIQARPRIATPVLLFLFWTVHGPFSLFLLARKRENGGCKAPAIFMAEILPARKGEHQPPSPARGKTFLLAFLSVQR